MAVGEEGTPRGRPSEGVHLKDHWDKQAKVLSYRAGKWLISANNKWMPK